MRPVILSLLIFLSCCIRSYGAPVPLERAKARALQFMEEVAPGRRMQLQWQHAQTKAGPAEPEYYIFTDPRGGFVIAGGDDAVPAVLGYSTTSSLRTEGMPENLRGWLDMWADIVSEARRRGASPASSPARSAEGDKIELETALWDQSDPYNRYCIEMDGKRAVTGCVATALAIAMRYHRWPASGSGTLPSYVFADEDSGKPYTVEPVTLGRPYAWDQMPMTRYDGTWNDTQKDEVAYLMRDLGVMVQASYSPKGTGAFMEDVTDGMVRYMGYDGALFLDSKSLYGDVKDWVEVLKDNIREVGPVVYAAVSEGGNPTGHAFILDGYDEYDNLRINWGWSGNGNGYFVMPAFNEYTRGHQALLGMKKDAGGAAPEDLRLYNVGLSASQSTFSEGTSFTMSCRSVANYSSVAFSGEVAFAKFSLDGTMDELLSDPVPLDLESLRVSAVADVPCVVGTPVKVGDVARLVYRSEMTPVWTPVRYNHESMVVGYVPIGDQVFLEDIVSVSYDVSTGLVTVSFSDTAGCELRLDGKAVTEGVTDDGATVTIDANRLPPAAYTLHLVRGQQEKDITLKFGLKK